MCTYLNNKHFGSAVTKFFLCFLVQLKRGKDNLIEIRSVNPQEPTFLIMVLINRPVCCYICLTILEIINTGQILAHYCTICLYKYLLLRTITEKKKKKKKEGLNFPTKVHIFFPS